MTELLRFRSTRTLQRLRSSSSSQSHHHQCQIKSARVFLIVHILSAFLIQSIISSSLTDKYVEQLLSSPDICPPVSSIPFGSSLTKEKIRLANFPNNTVIVKLSQRQESNSPSAFLNFRCKFQVTAPKGYAVMVVIRSLYLRPNGPGICRDYIQFKREGNYKSGEICGEVQADDKESEPLRLIGPRYFNDYPGASMDVTFSTGGNAGQTDKPILLELVFTAFSRCAPPNSGAPASGQCSSTVCIPNGLVCDGVINCGIDVFGKDEEDCADVGGGPSRAMSIFIFGLTAVGTLLVVIAFLLLTCCCLRRFDKWKPCPRSTPDSESRDVEFHLSRADSFPPSHTSAPAGHSTDPHWRSTSPNAPKLEDLPPSYGDLFPEQRISAKT